MTYLGSSLVHQIVLGAAFSFCIAGSSVFLIYFDLADGFTGPLLMLSVALPIILAREFARRYSMAGLRPQDALLLDAASALIQIGLMGALAANSLLNVEIAIAIIAAANGVALLPWWRKVRPKPKFLIYSVVEDFRRNRKLGMWNFAALSTFLVHLYAASWLLMITKDGVAVGIFAACHTVVMLTNPIMQGIANNLMPRNAHAWAMNGLKSVQHLVRSYALILFGAMGAPCLLLVAFGDQFLVGLFGSEFAGHADIIGILAFATVIRACAMSAYIGLWAAAGSQVNAYINLIGLSFLVASFTLLVPHAGLAGAAIAVVIGDATSAALRFLAFYRLGHAAIDRVA